MMKPHENFIPTHYQLLKWYREGYAKAANMMPGENKGHGHDEAHRAGVHYAKFRVFEHSGVGVGHPERLKFEAMDILVNAYLADFFYGGPTRSLKCMCHSCKEQFGE